MAWRFITWCSILAIIALAAPAPLFTAQPLPVTLLARVLGTFEEQDALRMIAELRETKDPDRELYLGILYHNIVVNNVIINKVYNWNHLEKAIGHFERAYRDTKNPVALAFLGSATTLEAQREQMRNNIVPAAAKVQQGTAAIGRALRLDPQSVLIHFINAINAVEVSERSPYQKYDIARKSLDFIKSQYQTLPAVVQAQYHILEGRIAIAGNRVGDALRQFENAARISPDTLPAKIALRYISELEE